MTPLRLLMSEIDPENRKRWYEKFERTTEEVVRENLTLGRYHNQDEKQSVFEWLYEKDEQRKKLATRRFHLVFWVAVASVIVSALGINDVLVFAKYVIAKVLG